LLLASVNLLLIEADHFCNRANWIATPSMCRASSQRICSVRLGALLGAPRARCLLNLSQYQ